MDRQAIITCAQREVGTRETPVNKTKYGEWYGMNGVAWCAIFVSYVFDQAKSTLPPIDTGYKGFHYVPTLYNKAVKNKWLTDKPQPGDIVLFDFKTTDKKKFAQHTGIFVSWNQDGTFNSIEGNTSPGNAGSQDQGDVVAFRRRNKILALGFVNIDLIK